MNSDDLMPGDKVKHTLTGEIGEHVLHLGATSDLYDFGRGNEHVHSWLVERHTGPERSA